MAAKDRTDGHEFARCQSCGAQLAPGAEQCPVCGKAAEPSQSKFNVRGWLSWRNFCRALIAVLLIVVINLYGTSLNRFLPLIGLLRFSPIVTEALELAREHQGVLDLLGGPIEIAGSVEGYINGFDWAPGKSQLRIPVQGVKSRGTLSLIAGNGQGPWIFTELKLSTDQGTSIDLLDHLPGQQPAMVQTSRRVYLVPLGNVRDLGLSELPKYYRDKFGLAVELLAPVAVDASMRDSESGRLIADEFDELMKRRLPHLANDQSAVLIGVTHEDMYIRDLGPSSMYNYFVIRGHFGVVSSYLLRFRQEDMASIRTRVRKLITRDIGIMAFHFPKTSDPTSVLAASIGPASNIDLVMERFEGLGPRAVVDEYRRARNEPSYDPKLLSTYSEVEPKKVDGRYPCLLMKRQQTNGRRPVAFSVTVDKCLPKSFIDSEVDEIELDLRFGLIITRRTDLFVPGTLPVAATRCYRSWDSRSRTFGRNTDLSWDMYPVGDKHPFTIMDLYLCGGSQVHYKRISQGSGFADVLYEHRQTATPFLGSRMRWNGNAWAIKLVDGTEIFFPGAHKLGLGNDSGLIEFRGANGESVTIERDRRRNLKRLVGPNEKSITFEHDAWNRVVRAVDDQKRVVNYAYDVAGRLVEVQRLDTIYRFDYDYADITSIYENGQRLVQFQYSSGLVEQISLLDGRKYKIRYDDDPKEKFKILRTYLTVPDGTVHKFEFTSNDLRSTSP